MHHKWILQRVIPEYALPSLLVRCPVDECPAALHQVRKFKNDLPVWLEQPLPFIEDCRNFPNEEMLNYMDSHQFIGASVRKWDFPDVAINVSIAIAIYGDPAVVPFLSSADVETDRM